MPYLSITTNVALTAEAESAFTTDVSKALSSGLGKPEAYVMVSVQTVRTLRFAASPEPAAFLDLKSIGLPRSLEAIASSLTALAEKHAGIAPDRVFINFSDIAASHWAHAGATFA